MLNLAEQFQAEKRPKQTTIEQWASTLDPDDREALENARTDADLSDSAIRRVLREAGKAVGKDTVVKWRRG